MVNRQFPKPAEWLELMHFKKPELDGKKRRLSAALTIEDLRTIAKRRTPKAAFDYKDGAADGELSLARARQAFQDIEFLNLRVRPARRSSRSAAAFSTSPRARSPRWTPAARSDRASPGPSIRSSPG
jgi:L-lactate dehydrogenase (cytochrome)